jgi:hypothetical protein
LQEGTPEPAVDAFIPKLGDVAGRLGKHVKGKIGAVAARVANGSRADVADSDVDSLIRHIESYLDVEGMRRHGPFAVAARNLHKLAFPKGLGFINDRIVDENATCRELLALLRDPQHKDTLAGIKFPFVWLDELEAALAESEAAMAEVTAARTGTSGHVVLGRDAEEDWVDLMRRLRKQMEARASADEVEKMEEGKMLIAPLLDALKKMHADAATRTTKRGGTKKRSTKPAETRPVEAKPPEPSRTAQPSAKTKR